MLGGRAPLRLADWPGMQPCTPHGRRQTSQKSAKGFARACNDKRRNSVPLLRVASWLDATERLRAVCASQALVERSRGSFAEIDDAPMRPHVAQSNVAAITWLETSALRRALQRFTRTSTQLHQARMVTPHRGAL